MKGVGCIVEGCENEAFYKRSGLCHACYQAMYYWRGASPTRLIERKKDLLKFSSRMEALLPRNVFAMKRRRSA